MVGNNHKSSKPEIGREYPKDNENEIIGEIIRLTMEQMERLYAKTRTLRQVHAKMHGCLKAEFVIEKDLTEDLRVGVFKEAKTYEAWVRFSNGKTQINHDKEKDTRGAAIKLLNVPGEKLLDISEDQTAQDFVLASSPFFFAKDLEDFTGLLKASIAKNYKLKGALYLIRHFFFMGYRTLFKILMKCRHPFEIPYFSGTPYQFGDERMAVKYHLRPSPGNKLEYTDEKDFDYLRHNMALTLKHSDMYFDFCIQKQTDAVKMPIEDATIVWKSPFIKVATLKIPVQEFNNEERDLFGDNLTFNIWHSLPEHRPLGSFNRGRKFIYKELYKFRKERNKRLAGDPTAEPILSDNLKLIQDDE